jgi:hypothetical protein
MLARSDRVFLQRLGQLLFIAFLTASCSAERTHLDAQETAIAKREIQIFLEQDRWARQAGNVAVCPDLLDALKSGSDEVRVVDPAIRAAEYDPDVFSRYQGRCPALPFNTITADEFVYPYVGTKNAKAFEVPRRSGGTWFLFYAEGYYNEGIGSRTTRDGGYSFGPGNSAYYTAFDLTACTVSDRQAVHEPTYHLTDESLPNRNAVIEYRGEFWIIDLFAEFNDRAKRHVAAMLMSERAPSPINAQCRFNNG